MQIKKFSILLKKINIVGKILRAISRFFVTLNNDYQSVKKENKEIGVDTLPQIKNFD